MESFKIKFVEEAVEYLSDLEDAILKLEQDTENMSLIEQIFRIMHTLKGNSAMFGFTHIDRYTHQLETIYDLIRNDRMKVTGEVLNFTLTSVDHLSNLLKEEDNLSPGVKETHEALLKRIDSYIQGEGQEADTQEPEEEAASLVAADKAVTTFYIAFQPDEDFLLDGSNPMYLVDDFHGLGDCMAFANKRGIPAIEELDPEKCYLKWELVLSTNEGLDAVNEVFIFAEDSCSIDIQEVSRTSLVSKQEFREQVHALYAEQGEIGFNRIRAIADAMKVTEQNATRGDKPEKPGAAKNKNTISSIRVSSEKLDDLMNLVSELVTNQASLSLQAEFSNNPEIISIAENMEKVTRQLRDNVFDICLIPIDTIMIRFQRLVRDLSSELNKKVEFVTEGTETELDKNIIESLADPIMHILRNSMDHGLETGPERRSAGKPETGKIVLKAFYSGMNVFIQIQDDGRGIDPEKIRQKAIAKGLVTPDTVLDSKEIFDFLFLPGFSTASKVTDVSGRGVGMDVVKRKINDIRGSVEVDSKVGEGTTITIKLPLTLSIIDGLLVKIKETFYVIQLPVVDKVYEIPTETLVMNRNRQVTLDGELVPCLYLREEFMVEGASPKMSKIIVVKYGNQRVGLSVDEIIGEYQAVLKPLSRLFGRQEFVSGAAILGDGTVALVLDSNLIIDTYSSKAAEPVLENI